MIVYMVEEDYFEPWEDNRYTVGYYKFKEDAEKAVLRANLRHVGDYHDWEAHIIPIMVVDRERD